MKTISILFFALFLAVSSFGRVRSFPPDNFRVLQSRCIDSVEFLQVLVAFDGKSRIAVVRMDCECVVKRGAAVALFGFTAYSYVKPRELPLVYTIINNNY